MLIKNGREISIEVGDRVELNKELGSVSVTRDGYQLQIQLTDDSRPQYARAYEQDDSSGLVYAMRFLELLDPSTRWEIKSVKGPDMSVEYFELMRPVKGEVP